MTCTRHLQISIVIFIVVCALEHSAKAWIADNDCYGMADGADYRGSISITTTGKTCQQWTSQTPHAHSRTPENYPDAGLGDHNVCRNPDGEPTAWCYTTDPNTRWEVCDIGSAGKPCECFEMSDGADYRGSIHTTISGETCKKWTSQTAHEQSVTSETYPDTGLGDHNFCRNPTGDTGAWCFSMDVGMFWEGCDIGSPEENCECYRMTDGADYRGSVHITTTGKTCQQWTSQTPHAHSRTPENYPDAFLGDHNECRNPDGEPNAWCYTTDSNTSWEFCDIGSPGEPCDCVHSTTDGDYIFRYDLPRVPNDVTRIEFSAKAPFGIHIALSAQDEELDDMYEIVIGIWGNTRSAIRRCKSCEDIVFETIMSGFLDSNEYRGFWIEFVSGDINVGYTGGPRFLNYHDSNPLEINYVGYSTSMGSGSFIFCDTLENDVQNAEGTADDDGPVRRNEPGRADDDGPIRRNEPGRADDDGPIRRNEPGPPIEPRFKLI